MSCGESWARTRDVQITEPTLSLYTTHVKCHQMGHTYRFLGHYVKGQYLNIHIFDNLRTSYLKYFVSRHEPLPFQILDTFNPVQLTSYRSGPIRMSLHHHDDVTKPSWTVSRRGVNLGDIDTPTDVAYVRRNILAVSELQNQRIQVGDR